MPPATVSVNDAASDANETPPPASRGIAKRKHRREFAIPRVSFRRLVQEIMSTYKSDLRIQDSALDALQESSETLLAERFGRCAQLASLCKLDTIRDDHWRFVQNGDAVPCLDRS